MRVLGLAVDDRAQPVVLLTPMIADEPARVVVPVWIGGQEAASISAALRREAPPRPLSHDLMQRLLEATGATVDRVAITRLQGGIFIAELTVSTAAPGSTSVSGSTGTGPLVLDCRPSDAIALALRLGAPVFMAESVLDEAGVREDAADAPDASEQQVEAFRRFLDGVAPEDFQG